MEETVLKAGDDKKTTAALLLGVVLVIASLGWYLFKSNSVKSDSGNTAHDNNSLLTEISEKVLPSKGFQSKIVFGDSVQKLIENGVIDKQKFEALYQNRGGLPPEIQKVLDGSSSSPILLTQENANFYINFLWPLGLANYMKSNETSPINGKSLFNFASTGGWTLGEKDNGGYYFNKFKIVTLTPEQEALVLNIAENSYRPCCNNSTYFQDCNHGSALLGLLQLGAAQGLSEQELYREALVFNSFWFPQNYTQIGLYFKAVKNTDWNKVDPKVVLGKEYSSYNGSQAVTQELSRLNLLPQQKGGAGCGV